MRPLRHADATLIEEGIKDLSDRSRYLRFFSGFKEAPPSVLKKLTDFKDDNHLAWGAVDSSLQANAAIAAAHIIREDQMPPSTGDFALAVLDDYHNQGIARCMIACLFSDAITEGFSKVTLDVLNENVPAIKLFKSLGGEILDTVSNVVTMAIEINQALAKLKLSKIPALQDVFEDMNKRH